MVTKWSWINVALCCCFRTTDVKQWSRHRGNIPGPGDNLLLFQCYCWSISDHGIEVTPPGRGTTYCCICATVGLTCPLRRLIPEINRWGDPRWKVDVPWSDIRGRCSFWCSWPSSQQSCQWHRVELIDPRWCLLTAIYKRHAFTTRNMAACVVSCSEYLFGRSIVLVKLCLSACLPALFINFIVI